MELLTAFKLHRPGLCLEGFFFGTISLSSQGPVVKAVQHSLILGLYSGIFAMYLHHGSQSTDRARNILFYALCLLYALAVATYIMAILKNFELDLVSIDHHGWLTFFPIGCTEWQRDCYVPPTKY